MLLRLEANMHDESKVDRAPEETAEYDVKEVREQIKRLRALRDIEDPDDVPTVDSVPLPVLPPESDSE